LQLLKEFKDLRLEHIPRLHNEEANWLAQHALGYQPILEVLTSVVVPMTGERKSLII